jgi:3-hydroxybutyryl-CoA dehydrogenase
MTLDSIQRIAVIGAGTMGQGIAQACATAGFDVLLYDVQEKFISNGLEAVHRNLSVAIEKNKITSEDKETIAAKISGVKDFNLLKVDLVIEAIVEKIEVKQQLFASLEKVNKQNCVFTSNTSSLSITQIASSLTYANRFAGLHFFNPATLMKLVEVVHGSQTQFEIIELLQRFVKKLNKVPVTVKDAPGFIVNRVARQYYLEAFKLVEDGLADMTTVDSLLKSSGFKMGPFELVDMIGMDVNYAVTASMYEAFNQEPRFKPSKLQQRKVQDGHLGRKTGKGFYDYK